MVDDRSTTEIVTISSSISRPYTEHLDHEPVVLRFTSDDAVREVAA
jgi:hypothetical protein